MIQCPSSGVQSTVHRGALGPSLCDPVAIEAQKVDEDMLILSCYNKLSFISNIGDHVFYQHP